MRGGNPGRDLGPRGREIWMGSGLWNCMSQDWVWFSGWDLGPGLGSGTQVGLGSECRSRSWEGVWVVVGVQGGAPGRVLDAGNGSGSQVGSTSWSRDWVPGGSPGLGSGLHMVSGFCVGVQVQGCGLGPGLGSGSQVGV